MTQPRRTGSRSGSARSTRSAASRSRSSGRASAGKRRSTAARSTAAASRADTSVQAFRDSLERSVTISRDRMQDVVDDAVKRGRMTRDDANELVSKLVSRSRRYTDDLLRDLEKMLNQTRREVESRVTPARRQVERAAGKAGRAARDGGSGPWPIAAYDQLTATQVKQRLADLSAADLRKVRTQERRGKARKSVLDDIERRLAK